MDLLVSFLNPGMPDRRVLGLLSPDSLEFRTLRLPPELSVRSGITGLALSPEYVFAVLQVSRPGSRIDRFAPPALVTFDRHELRVTSQYAFSSAVDVHSLCLDGDTLYAVSTGTDELLALRLDGPRVVGETVFWRPEIEARYEDIHHLNAVCCRDGDILVSGFGRKAGALWSSALDGFVVNATQGTIVERGIHQPHSLLMVDGVLAYCESAKRSVQLGEDLRIRDLPGYTRGLSVVDGKLYVGTSNRRRVSKSTGAVVLPLEEDAPSTCAVSRLSLASGLVEKTVDLSAYAEEIYDILPVQGTGEWPADDPVPLVSDLAWLENVEKASAQLLDIVPAGTSFVLVDEDRWGIGPHLQGRQKIPFLQRDGEYWGPPPDDDTAIQSLESLRVQGAGFVIVGWPAFWWLDTYPGFHCHLRARFPCAFENDHLIVFQLTA